MKRGEFSDKEQLVLAGLDFDRYSDPVAKSIGDWHEAFDRWNHQLHLVHYGEGGRTQAEADVKLAHLQDGYTQAFEHAARQVAADSPIEESAVDTLHNLFRAEEQRRLTHVSQWYTTEKLQPSSDEYFHDIVMPFADPEGKTIIHSNDEFVLSQEAALELYRARLEDHSRAILLQKYRNLAESGRNIRSVNRKFYTALGAVGLGSFWAAFRAFRPKRK
ncbi:MAG: hypothetical protein H6797_04150 [Candidatus Nomurabacteria bacterium]|nr:MAG: hypothetical protein H6797_04150 [Candidatus Nomurabacteria bacterium]